MEGHAGGARPRRVLGGGRGGLLRRRRRRPAAERRRPADHHARGAEGLRPGPVRAGRRDDGLPGARRLAVPTGPPSGSEAKEDGRNDPDRHPPGVGVRRGAAAGVRRVGTVPSFFSASPAAFCRHRGRRRHCVHGTIVLPVRDAGHPQTAPPGRHRAGRGTGGRPLSRLPRPRRRRPRSPPCWRGSDCGSTTAPRSSSATTPWPRTRSRPRSASCTPTGPVAHLPRRPAWWRAVVRNEVRQMPACSGPPAGPCRRSGRRCRRARTTPHRVACQEEPCAGRRWTGSRRTSARRSPWCTSSG